ncbi:MAG TPA: acyl-homoserine-lactone synthase [Caulobacteraceae bacterium]
MIHVVTAENRRHYAHPLWEMFQIRKRHYVDERGWGELWNFEGVELDDSDDERTVYLMSLGPAEELWGFVRIRPTDDRSILVDKFPYLVDASLLPLKGPETWEGSRIWVDGTAGAPHAGMHRLLTAAAEYILRIGGRRLLALLDVHNFPHLADGALEFTMTGPPGAYRYGVMVGVKHELSEDAVGRMRDSLGEAKPLTYVVEDEDLAVHGDLARVQRVVDLARSVDGAATRIDQATPAKTMARIGAYFVRHDATPERTGLWVTLRSPIVEEEPRPA